MQPGLWDHEAMAWALAVTVVLAIGVPIGAWTYTRLRPPPPLSRLGTAYDPIDKWLLRQYALTPIDRERVRDAVFNGRQVGDPELTLAARDLAESVLAGKLRRSRQSYGIVWINMIMATCFLAMGIISLIAGHALEPALGAVFVLSSAVLMTAAVMPRRQPRKVLFNVAKARQLNQDAS
jgi:uncharacterized membrane protein YfcA